ncbi:hypothetical protein AB1Y20_018247 [Prymnesium parvum]|uniref:Uncharacterized protein n=1 Tax=Prymnesium parvum TaxID=97485 RepID=A0AB34JP27_PRYPA
MLFTTCLRNVFGDSSVRHSRSTFVFYFGLVVLTVSALFSFFMKSLVNRQLRERTPLMRWYHYITHHEGMQGLVERAEEMKKSRRAAKRGVSNSAAQDKGATTVADIELVNQAESRPSKAYPEGSEVSGASYSRTTAREGELPRTSQAQESDEHYRLRIAINWQRLAMLDVFVWCLVHLTCLLGTFIVLIMAAIQYSDEKSQFSQGPSVSAGSP